MAGNQRTCTIDGCDRAHRARGLCATHYNAAHRTPNPTAQFVCPACGKTFTAERARANRYRTLYCSQPCMGRGFSARASQIMLWRPRPVLHLAVDRMLAVPTPEPRMFVAGRCRRCSTAFVDRQITAVFCSPLCARRWHRDEAKARKGYRVPRAIRTYVYKRDRNTCQLCRRPVDMTLPHQHPMSATLDHIVCQSWTLVPDHSPANLRLAHMICNAQRGNRVVAS